MSAHDPAELAAARPDFAAIAAWIPQGASVLDLGCGDGSLLRYLNDTRKVRGYGVEISDANIVACIRNGVNVIQGNLESGLSGFESNAFDYVLLSQTLQATRHTEPLVQEMLRVGREGIVSFPNFGYWKLRKQLFEEGRAPRSSVLKFSWYNSPNVRFLTIADFREFCQERGIRIHEQVALDTETYQQVRDDPNLNADLSIFVVSR